ncbi:hypothetical protein Plhal703r1_c89g0174171 [Plasmopara halstedii]
MASVVLTQVEVTWRDLDPPARLAYLLKQPIWFHSASEFQYVLATRTDTSKVQRRSFCMVAEPQRSYRQHVANAFQIRSLSDFLCPDGTWPDVDTFARSHIDYRYMLYQLTNNTSGSAYYISKPHKLSSDCSDCVKPAH